MSQQFKTVDVLRLEVEDDPTGLTNMVKNPSGELGGWAWVTPVAGSSLSGTKVNGIQCLLYTSPGAVPSHFRTETMPVAAGQYVAASWRSGAGVQSGYHRARFEFLSSSMAVLSSSPQSAYISNSTPGSGTLQPVAAPASTAWVRLRFDHYSDTAGGNAQAFDQMSLYEVTVAKADTFGGLGTQRYNLVPNPSFEGDAWGWSGGTRSTAQAYTGSASLKADLASRDWTDITTSTRLPIEGGRTYTVSYYYKATKITAAGDHVIQNNYNFYDASGAQIGGAWVEGSFHLAVSGTWTRASFSVTAPANAVSLRLLIGVYNPGVGAEVYIDAVMVEASTAVKPYFDGATPDTSLSSYDWDGLTTRTNLVVNPSFETGITGWVESGAYPGSVAQGTAGTKGTKSLQLSGPGYVGAVNATHIPVSAGKTYTLSADAWVSTWTGVRTDGIELSACFNGVIDGTRRGIYWRPDDMSAGNTLRKSVTFTVPAGKTYVTLWAYTGDNLAAGAWARLDGLLLEDAALTGDYFDGSTADALPYADRAWTGTANASTSTEARPARSSESSLASSARTNLVTNPSMEAGTTVPTNITFSGNGDGVKSAAWADIGTYSLELYGKAGGTTDSWAYVQGAATTAGNSNLLQPGKSYYIAATIRLVAPLTGTLGTNKLKMHVWYNTVAGSTGATNVYSAEAPNAAGVTRLEMWVTIPANAVWAVLRFGNGASSGNGSVWWDSVLVVEAPAGSAPVPYFDGSTPDTGTVDYAWTGAVHASTSTATVSNFAYIEPVPYLDILSSSHEISVVREPLNTGTLSATVLSATLDPSRDDLIRPGRRMRLTAFDGSSWFTLFVGKISEASVTYEYKDPAVPTEKRARIVLTAVDAVADLANQKRTEGVATIDELPYVLEGCGVPWNVNGSGNQVPLASVVARNENASAVDQVAVTRDSVLGYAWVDRNGVLNVWDAAQIDSGFMAIDGHDYSDVDIAYNTLDCINEVSVSFLRMNPATGETEEIAYGPYRDENSIATWGVRSATFTVQGIEENPAALEGYASNVLGANSTPRVRVNSFVVPVMRPERVAFLANVHLDLYGGIQIHVDGKPFDPDADNARVTRIEHSITPDKWLVTYGLSLPTGSAPPQFVPSPPTGAAGRTIGQLLRPVGELTMWFGNVGSSGSGTSKCPVGSPDWLVCDGATFSSADFPELATLLGGTTLPNLVDRFPIGAGTKALGTSGGAATKAVPPHTHGIEGQTAAGAVSGGTAATNAPTKGAYDGHAHGGATLAATGSAFDVMNPWRAVHFLIRAR